MRKILKILIPIFIAVLFVLSSCSISNITSNVDKNNEIKVGSLDYEYEENKVLVGYENREAVEKVVELLNGEISVDLPEIKMVSIKFNGTVKEAIDKVLKSGIKGLRYIEPSYKREIIDPKPVSTDAKIFKNTNDTVVNTSDVRGTEEFSKYMWGLEAIDVKAAWDSGITGKGVIVAVIDTGVDGTHPDLKGQVIEGYRPLTDEELPAGTDSSFGGAHGTHVAGTIAASNNTLGIVGVAPDAKIMPIVIFDTKGYVGDDEVAEGIIWAVQHGADILQNSWGGWGYSYTLKEAFDYALDNNVVVTVSAGNDHTDQHLHYPSGYPGIIQVAAVEYNGGDYRTTWFSNRSDAITVGAPGVDILSTVPQATALGYEGASLADSLGGLYDFYQGTSMACPHVSGVVALLLEKYPSAKVWQIRQLLENGAHDIDEEGFDHSSGYGLVNVENSISSDLPSSGGINYFEIEAVDSWSYGIPGVFVTLKRLEGSGGDYFAKTDTNGIAHFSNIDAGKYEIIVGGPDSNDRSYSGDGYYGMSFAKRRAEERQYSKVVDITSDSTETFTFTSEFKVEFGEPTTTLGNAIVTLDSVLYELIYGIRGTYMEYTFKTNAPFDFSAIADLVYLRVERESTGVECTIPGTVTLNGVEIPVIAEFSEDATLTEVTDGVAPYWYIFGQ